VAPARPLTQAQATGALLSAAEVGTGFTARRVGSPSPPPCEPAGTPAITTQAPPAVAARRAFAHRGNDAFLTQDVYGYADSTRAQAALVLFEGSFGCTNGTAYYSDGTTGPLTISHPTPIGSNLDVDAGTIYDLRFTAQQGSVIVARIGATVLVLTFIAATSASSAGLPDGQSIVAASIRKIHAAR
jgi:hypothetical protein